MTRRSLPVALVTLALVACTNAPTPLIGKPRIAGAPVKTAASSKPTASARPSQVPSTGVSIGPPASQEPPPAPVSAAPSTAGTGGGGTTTATPTPDPNASPVLSLVAGSQPSNTWQLGTPMRRARAGLGAAVLGNRLCAIEGENSPSMEAYALGDTAWGLTNTYDLSSNPADLNTALRNGRALFVVGATTNAVFTAGGSNGLGPLDSLTRYLIDGPDGEVPALLSSVKAAAGGLSGDTFVLVGGVDATGTVQNDTQLINTTSAACTVGTNMPTAVAGAASVAIGSKIYVLGGYTLTGATATPQTSVQVYDLLTNAWRKDGDGKTAAPLPLPEARHSAAAAVLDGKIYVAGGIGAAGTPLGTILVYDPVANTWATKAAMSTPRALLALAAFQGRLWALGGFDAAGKALSSVEAYKP